MKLLDAQKKHANELSIAFPLTRLERFALGRALSHTPPGSEGKSRKDLFNALERTPGSEPGLSYVWEDDQLTDSSKYEERLEMVLTERMLKDLGKFVDDVHGAAPGRHAYALLDVQERAKWILDPPQE